MTVVVVQSDEFSAWIGVAGVAVGVVLAAAIDWQRTRRADRRETRNRLLHAGSELAAAARTYYATSRAAGPASNEPAWHELIQGRLDAMGAAALTINLAGDKNIEQASLQIVKAAAEPPASASMAARGPTDPADFVQQTYTQVSAQAAVIAAYREAVRKAKL